MSDWLISLWKHASSGEKLGVLVAIGLAVLTSLATVIGRINRKRRANPKQQQVVSGGSIGIQGGGEDNVEHIAISSGKDSDAR